MHYPWWHVPYLTAPMLIAVVSVLHVLVSHYAVGGRALPRRRDQPRLPHRKRGLPGLSAATRQVLRPLDRRFRRHQRRGHLVDHRPGVAAGHASLLIRTFVFGWATEYVFFILEIVSAFIFYYYWGRLSPRIHTVIVWIYGLSAWISLVLDHGHHGVHARSGQLAQGPQLLERGPQFADPAADRRPDRRGVAAQLALRLSARGA